MSKHSILCGSCKSQAKCVANPGPGDKVTCSGCGREDRFDDVMKSVKDYVIHSMAQSFDRSFQRIARGSKFLKVTSKSPSHRSFRWTTSNLGI